MEPPEEKPALLQVPVPWFISEPWGMGRVHVEQRRGRGGERPMRMWMASENSRSERGSWRGEELRWAQAQLSLELM